MFVSVFYGWHRKTCQKVLHCQRQQEVDVWFPHLTEGNLTATWWRDVSLDVSKQQFHMRAYFRQMLQHLHHHWLYGRHFHQRKALLQQLFKLPISEKKMENTIQSSTQAFYQLSQRSAQEASEPRQDSPVLILALCNDSDLLHQLLSKLVEDRLVELQPRGPVKVEEGQSGLQRRQQDAILHLQSRKTIITHISELYKSVEHIHLLTGTFFTFN